MDFCKDGFAHVGIFTVDVFLFVFIGAAGCTRIHESIMLCFLYPRNEVLYFLGSAW